jgi:hypothetical protein
MMANKTMSKAVGKGKGLKATAMPRKRTNTPSIGHHAGTKRAPGYC